ncbi:MAG: 50S ribosomal protein L24 [Nitrospirae bacterium]|nr:50S ribosomal protein L24 [Nitrospirota bacterium]
MKVRKGDQVTVVSGKEKGKSGLVTHVIPAKGKVFVEKLNIVTKHMKPNAKNRQGGILEREGPIHVSNVMIVCPKCAQPTRIGIKRDAETRMRFCKACGEVVDLQKK